MPRGAVLVAGLLLGCPGAAAGSDDFFEARVRPVLTERCLSCHGPKGAKSGLRLDSRSAVLRGGDGGPVVVPGKPAESRLVQAVRHAGDLKMPAKPLPAAEVAALEKWVELGLPWPKDVELVPPDRMAEAGKRHWAFQPVRRPPVPGGAGHPIDAFVRARLTEHGLKPSPAADKRTLVRRVTFDLVGLPPTPAEVEAFLTDESPGAYDRLIDRLLASPHYGERWARHWLDVARYADNKGYVFFEGKDYPWAWTYRDYVVRSFNADKPYDRFVLEQLAADLLPPDAPTDLAALGFLTVGGHFMNNVHDILDDRIDVVTRGLMGLTVTCARCHDHKYDPVPQADYYSLYGVFRSTVEPTVPPLLGPPPDVFWYRWYTVLLADRERKLFEFVTARHRELVNGARTRAGEYLMAARATRDKPPDDDFMLLADKGDLNPAMITRWRVYLDGSRGKPDPVWLPWHTLAGLPETEVGRQVAELKADPAVNRLVREALPASPAGLKDVADAYGRLLARVDRDYRWAVGVGKPSDPAAEQLRQVLYGPRSPADAPLALDWGFLSLFPDRPTQGEYQRLLKDVETMAAKGPPRPMTLADAPQPHDPRVFVRGSPNRLGEYVSRQFLSVLKPGRKPFAVGSGRLELAREISAPTNPLTARVMVNRVWMHHFGQGLVRTPGDFGLRGDPPTHPELLDWLAAEFVERGWSVKSLHRLILTSETYRQQSLDRPDGRTVDPDNRLLWRANRRRLDFEGLHDSMLAVSGGLDPKAGGPPVKLFGANRRRAVYGYVDRLEFPSLLSTFDVPNPAASVPERTATTVPPQALYLMNGPFPREAARRLASSTKSLEPAARVYALFRAAYGRSPTAEETGWTIGFVWQRPTADRWVDLAHGLLLTNEFTFID